MSAFLVTSWLMSVWAVPPGEEPPLCQRPLEFSDFNRYDVVADQQLHKSELTDTLFDCLVRQLVRTADRRVRSYYLGRLQNHLWEAVRRRLLRLIRSPRLPPAVRARIRDLLAFELSDRLLRTSVLVRYNFRWDRVVDRDAGLRTVSRYARHELLGSGSLSVNVPFGGWRFKSWAALTASYLYGITGERETGVGAASGATRDARSYPSLTAASSLSVTERRDRFRLVSAAQVVRYWEPLADQLASRGSLSSTLEVRKPWDTGFGARLTGSWVADRYAPPLDDSYNRQQVDRATVAGEVSYHFKRLGVLATYGYVDSDTTDAFDVTRNESHTSALLGHLRFGGGYLRFGGGGGVWQESFQQLDDPAPSVTEGAAVHARLELQWQPVKWLSGTVLGTAQANRSEGDFNGWYPSWSSQLKLMVSTRRVSAQGAAGWWGHHRDLDHRQDRQGGWAWAEAMVHTSDRWNLRAVVWGGRTRQTRYQGYDEAWWGGSATVGVRLHRRPDLWLEASGSLSGYRYREDGLGRDLVRSTAGVYANGRF